ncbi:hypothetical protein SAMN05216283_101388 [Sunxiuqinia elliptica]|uniref:Uncharacterized protein n=1 Tax=Sunxiuqinia elliptica TaxID=655355 RepID=A0A1I2BGG6_9BACT|nr:hypothetical protein SAMN05216283_101388 [Sunxiuqinia elliptica]
MGNDHPLSDFSTPREPLTRHCTIFGLHSEPGASIELFLPVTTKNDRPQPRFCAPRQQLTVPAAVSGVHYEFKESRGQFKIVWQQIKAPFGVFK